MDAWLLSIQPWVFFVIAIILFGLLAVLGYQGKTVPAFIVLLGAVFSSTFVYIDHISEIAATATSLTIKVREASDALNGLKKLAVVTGQAIISLDSKVGTISGDPAADRERRKEQVLDVLRSLNLDQQSLTQVANSDRERNLSDYAAAIMNRVYNCGLLSGGRSEWNMEFVNLQTTANSWPPSPEQLKSIVTKYKITDDFVLKIIDEYDYYFKTGDHKDMQFWRARETWPTQPASGAGSPGKCAS